MGLFGKKKIKDEIKLSADLLVLEELKNDDEVHLIEIAKHIKSGIPYIINFQSLHIDHANKAIAFISGVVYAIDGHYMRINDATYLFGNQTIYDDGSLNKWLQENL